MDSRLRSSPQAPFSSAAASVVALAFLAYWPALSAGFVWDDYSLLTSQVLRDARDGLGEIWSNPGAMPGEEHFWPVVYSVFWLQTRLWGLEDASGFHLVNMLLHAANSGLVFLLLWRLGVSIRGAWGAGALFALHPVHVESVAWVIELKDVLSGFFYLLSALAFWEFRGRNSRRMAWLGLALLLFALGMLSKTIVVTLPFALLFAIWWREGQIRRGDIIALLPMLALGFALALLDMGIAARAGSADFELPLITRFQVAGHAVWFYLAKLVWPVGLMPIYPRWQFRETDLSALLPGAAMGAVWLILWAGRRRLGRGPVCALSFYLLTLGPLLGFVRFSFMQHSFVADRFQYLASLGPLALAGGAWAALDSRISGATRFAWRILLGLALLVLAGLTWRQTKTWHDAKALFGRNISLNRETWLGHQVLGHAMAAEGDWAGAAVVFQRAAELKPEDSMNRRNLAFVLARLGRKDEALRLLDEVLAKEPTDAKTAGLRRQIEGGEAQ